MKKYPERLEALALVRPYYGPLVKEFYATSDSCAEACEKFTQSRGTETEPQNYELAQGLIAEKRKIRERLDAGLRVFNL